MVWVQGHFVQAEGVSLKTVPNPVLVADEPPF
jgi:hypothetical protein